MYNAVVAKSPGKVFNYFRTLKTIPVAPNSKWSLKHTNRGCLTVRPKKIKNINLYFLVIFEE